MDRWIPAILRPAPAIKALTEPTEVSRQYRYWRFRILYSSLIGYALFYMVRKNLSVAMPAIGEDLGITKADLGLFLTLHGLCYGLSKFLNGILGDRTNPRYFMALGLVCAAAVNIGFGFSSTAIAFGLFWLVNGWFQGMGFPPCARSLTHWFAPHERGTRFAIWNTSHSIGAAAALLLCSGLVLVDWRLCFLVPAGLAMIGAVFLVNRLRDTPRSLGLPDIDEFTNGREAAAEQATTAQEPAFGPFVVKHVFLNPYIWIVSIANFFVYTIRYSILDWGPTMLKEYRGLELHHAGWVVAGYEVAGVAGMLLSGWLTDRIFRGRAARACLFYMAGCAVCIGLYWKLAPASIAGNIAFLCAMGFLIYGPQCLVGVVAANLATHRAAATAIGITGFFGYLSGILSGWGLGRLVETYGWEPVMGFLVAAGAAAMVLFALCWPAGQTQMEDPIDEK
ncbi:MAG: MFS transporter [Phycisphaerae bacterium]|nr:MFS transporter [Phycisphaerae bacterium]